MKIPIYQVDAFTSRVFRGNPAAICPLQTWLDDQTLQQIAAENNLSETAFLIKREKHYDLRWFTPTVEIDLCGHATLASAFIIFSEWEPELDQVIFETASGTLLVRRSEDLLTMEFPARIAVPIEPNELLSRALDCRPKEVLKARDLLAVFEDESQIRAMKPDFELLRQVQGGFGIIVSAPGDTADFVSRFFAPEAGIPEDPVTGSAHCTLIPFWSERMGKSKLKALQVSARGGELFCEDLGEKVRISGRAVLYSMGEIYL